MNQQPKLILRPRSRESLELPLSEITDASVTLPETMAMVNAVYNDEEYVFELPYEGLCCKDDALMARPWLRINGEDVACALEFVDDRVIFHPTDIDRNPFSNLYGLFQLEVSASTPLNLKLITSPLLVMLKDNEETRDLRSMAQFVAQNYSQLTLNDQDDNNPFINEEIKRLAALIEKITQAYESHVHYFNSHSHMRLVTVPRKDSFEKLKAFNGQTIQYILQHPEELMPVNYKSGIQFGQQNFAPKHTLVSDTIKTKDSYENRVLLGFLAYLITSAREILLKVNAAHFSLDLPQVEEGYLASTSTITGELDAIMVASSKKIDSSLKRLQGLLSTYRQVLPIQGYPLTSMPKPSSVFLRIPIYRYFYNLMAQWFQYQNVEVGDNRLLMPFLVNSRLYEYYVLLKLIEEKHNEGYEPVAKENFRYELSYRGKAVELTDQVLANTYYFVKGGERLTLYYQPVVYGTGPIGANAIGLQRISSLSYDSRQVSTPHYTPDYLLKYETDKTTRYVIGDAKYSRLNTVKGVYGSELAFKYLFGIRGIKECEHIEGVEILYGKRSLSKDGSFLDLMSKELTETSRPYFNYRGIFA